MLKPIAKSSALLLILLSIPAIAQETRPRYDTLSRFEMELPRTPLFHRLDLGATRERELRIIERRE